MEKEFRACFQGVAERNGVGGGCGAAGVFAYGIAFKGSNRDSRLQPILNHLFLGRVIGNPGAPWHNLREARKMVLDVRDKGICHLGQRVRAWHLRQHEDGGRDARLKNLSNASQMHLFKRFYGVQTRADNQTTDR